MNRIVDSIEYIQLPIFSALIFAYVMGYFTFSKLIARHPNDALGIFDMKIKKKLILEKEGRHKG